MQCFLGVLGAKEQTGVLAAPSLKARRERHRQLTKLELLPAESRHERR